MCARFPLNRLSKEESTENSDPGYLCILLENTHSFIQNVLMPRQEKISRGVECRVDSAKILHIFTLLHNGIETPELIAEAKELITKYK